MATRPVLTEGAYVIKGLLANCCLRAGLMSRNHSCCLDANILLIALLSISAILAPADNIAGGEDSTHLETSRHCCRRTCSLPAAWLAAGWPRRALAGLQSMVSGARPPLSPNPPSVRMHSASRLLRGPAVVNNPSQRALHQR